MSSPAHPPKDGASRYASGRHPVVYRRYRARCPTSNDRDNSALALLVRFRAANVNTKTVGNLFQILDFEHCQRGPSKGTRKTKQQQRKVALS